VPAVTTAEPSDVEAIADLLEEMDRFYGATDVEPADLRARQIGAALFANPPAAHALLAWEDTRVVGFAAYSFLWPAVALTRSLYLKELYVAHDSRRLGVGRLMMQSIFKAAAETECSRVEWTTDEDNPDAQRFYEKLGFPRHPSKLFYRLEGQELLRATDPQSTWL
jgi:GNAT superfamily N-acetyltransferase